MKLQHPGSQSLPQVVVQYGEPRSASTVGYKIMCQFMKLQHPGRTECFFATGCPKRPSFKPGWYYVIKTHKLWFTKLAPSCAYRNAIKQGLVVVSERTGQG